MITKKTLIPAVYLITFTLILYNCSALTEVYMCQTLGTTGEEYVLQNDLVSNGSCLRITRSGITLDLNGYSVTYGALGFDQVYNGDFEIEGISASVPDGWDFSQASQLQRTQGEFYELNAYSRNYSLSLHVDNNPFSEVITSGTFTLEPGHDFVLTGMYFCSNEDNCPVTLEMQVRNADDDTLIGLTKSINPGSDRGFRFTPMTASEINDATFQVTEPTEAYVLINITNSQDITNEFTIYLDYVRVLLKDAIGILNDNIYEGKTIKNGEVRLANLDCLHCHNIWGVQRGTVIKNLTTYVGGVDGKTLSPTGSTSQTCLNAEIHGNTFVHDNYNYPDQPWLDPWNIVKRRDWLYNMVDCGGGSGPYSIHDNNILGSIQNGILMSGSGPNKLAYNNYINQSVRYTNGFGIHVYGGDNNYVYNNTILTPAGRGIHIDVNTKDSYFYDNYIEAREPRNPEYDYLISYGIQMEGEIRNNPTRYYYTHDNVVSNNTILVETHPNRGNAAGLRLTGPLANNTIENNLVISTKTTTDPDDNVPGAPNGDYLYASGLDIYGSGDLETNIIQNNTFRSNHQVLRIIASYGLRLDSNTFEKTGSRDDFLTIFFPYGGGSGNNIIHNTIELNGADTSDALYWNHYVENSCDSDNPCGYNVTWSLEIRASDESGNPLEGAAAYVANEDLGLYCSGFTNALGTLVCHPIEFTSLMNLEEGPVDTKPGQIINFTNYNVTLEYNGTFKQSTVVMDQPRVISFSFSSESCPLTNDYPPCNCISTQELVNSIEDWFSANLEMSELVEIIRQWRICS